MRSRLGLTPTIRYNAKVHNHLPKLSELLIGLKDKSIDPTVIILHAVPQVQDRSGWSEDWVTWDSFMTKGREAKIGRTPSGEIMWHRGSFNDPLWILFSSGSTGKGSF